MISCLWILALVSSRYQSSGTKRIVSTYPLNVAHRVRSYQSRTGRFQSTSPSTKSLGIIPLGSGYQQPTPRKCSDVKNVTTSTQSVCTKMYENGLYCVANCPRGSSECSCQSQLQHNQKCNATTASQCPAKARCAKWYWGGHIEYCSGSDYSNCRCFHLQECKENALAQHACHCMGRSTRILEPQVCQVGETCVNSVCSGRQTYESADNTGAPPRNQTYKLTQCDNGKADASCTCGVAGETCNDGETCNTSSKKCSCGSYPKCEGEEVCDNGVCQDKTSKPICVANKEISIAECKCGEKECDRAQVCTVTEDSRYSCSAANAVDDSFPMVYVLYIALGVLGAIVVLSALYFLFRSGARDQPGVVRRRSDIIPSKQRKDVAASGRHEGKAKKAERAEGSRSRKEGAMSRNDPARRAAHARKTGASAPSHRSRTAGTNKSTDKRVPKRHMEKNESCKRGRQPKNTRKQPDQVAGGASSNSDGWAIPRPRKTSTKSGDWAISRQSRRKDSHAIGQGCKE